MSPQTNRSQLASGGSPACTRTHARSRTLVLFWLPTFLVHPLQTESEVPPPARHGHEEEEVRVRMKILEVVARRQEQQKGNLSLSSSSGLLPALLSAFGRG